jgi:hypothetical protein
VITGSWGSTTVTVKVHVEELPDGSVALDVTVVVPTGKLDPLAGVLTIVAEQLSVAVGVKVTIALQVPRGAVCVMFAGQVITGACTSLTVTVKVHDAALPARSVVVLVTVVVPTGNTLPLAGVLTIAGGVPLGIVPAIFNIICMFGNPIAAVVVGALILQSGAIR